MLNIVIAYVTRGSSPIRTTCVMAYPNNPYESEDVFNFFWMLSQSKLVAEFQVRDERGVVLIPSSFGWGCDKWVERITYQHEVFE